MNAWMRWMDRWMNKIIIKLKKFLTTWWRIQMHSNSIKDKKKIMRSLFPVFVIIYDFFRQPGPDQSSKFTRQD